MPPSVVSPTRAPSLLLGLLGAAGALFVGSVLLRLAGLPSPAPVALEQPLFVSFLSAACAWWAVAHAPADTRRDWRLCALGLSAWWLGDVTFTAYKHLAPGGEVPFPSWADLGYTLFAPLMTLALFGLLRPPRGPGLTRLLLDLGTAVITVFVLLWHFVYAGTVAESGRGLLALLVNLGYPLQDSLMLTLVLLIAFQDSVRLPRRAVRCLNVAFLANFTGDLTYAALLPDAHSAANGLVNVAFAVCLVGLGSAAVIGVTCPGERRTTLPPQTAALSPYLAIAVCFSLLVWGVVWGDGGSTPRTLGDLVGTGLVTLMVVLRQNLAFRENARLTAELARQATHDPLTGLANRALLETRLEEAITHARATGGHAAVLFLDLDRFKAVNDSLGHDVGDELLVAVARRLGATLRRGDTLARQGGDEFMAVLPGLARPGEADEVARRLLGALAAPFAVAGRSLVVTASVGVAVYPRNGADIVTLQKHADVAMYRVKGGGRDGYQVFSTEMLGAAGELDLEQALRGALARGEFELLYQPQVHAARGVVGVEALLRWRRDGEVVSPGQFIPLAEDTGVIVPIGAWVLCEACRQFAAWRGAGVRLERVAVNVSARQLADPAFPEVVLGALSAAGLAPDCLELELTESVVLRDVPGAARQLARLRALGVRVAVDDFGTGQSSLSLLRHVPADVLKIDRSFVAHLEGAEKSVALVRLVIALAQTLGLEVVAEGVETPGQWDILRGLGCQTAQGYAFAYPLPAAALAGWLAGREAGVALAG